MAVEIVVRLETIDIEQHDGDRRHQRAVIGPELLGGLLEPPAVGKPGQRIVPRLLSDFRHAQALAPVEQIGAPCFAVALKR